MHSEWTKNTSLHPGATADALQDVFRRQQVFAPTFRATTTAERLARLQKLRQALAAHRTDIQQAAAADFGKPAPEVELSEIFPVLHEITHARRHLGKWMRPVSVRPTLAMLGTKAQIRYEPKGVCLIISPWNYPFNLTFGPLVSAIAAGNTVIIKPSELTPHCSRLIRQIVEELYPAEEVAVFEGDAEVARMLLELPFNHIFFTGNPAIGRIVMRAAAEHLSSVTLELGGKSPAIVDESTFSWYGRGSTGRDYIREPLIGSRELNASTANGCELRAKARLSASRSCSGSWSTPGDGSETWRSDCSAASLSGIGRSITNSHAVQQVCASAASKSVLAVTAGAV